MDPNRKMVIQIGDALGLLKFAALPPGTSKKIFDNLKLTGNNYLNLGKPTIDYN